MNKRKQMKQNKNLQSPINEAYLIKGLFLVVAFYLAVQHWEQVAKLISLTWSAVVPLVYGIAIAFILNLIVNQLEKHMKGKLWSNKLVKRAISVTISIIIVIGVIVLCFMGLIPEMINSGRQIVEKVPPMLEKIIQYGEKHFGLQEDWIEKLKTISIDEGMLLSIVEKIESKSVIKVLETGTDIVGNVFGGMFDFFMGFFFALYILMRKEQLINQFKRVVRAYLPQDISTKIVYVAAKTNQVYAGFITGQCLDAILLGIMVSITMFIMKLSYPVLIGVIVAVTALIPVVGAFIGCAVAMFLLFIESPVSSLTFLIVFLILQQIDNKLIYPQVVGNAVGLPSIWIFAAIIVGGKVSGVAGMFLGIPLTALIYILVKEDVLRREKKSKKPVETSA